VTRRDDHLWDRTGEPDPDIERLEQVLAPLAHDRRELPLDLLPTQRPAPAPRRWPWLLAAALLLCAGGAAWLLYEPALAEGDAPRPFAALETPRTIELGDLATLTLQPGSEVRFEHWRKDEALFSLQKGGLEAHVQPTVKPRFFQIATALGRVVDQGCRFELSLDAQDRAHVRVTEGAVTFEFPQRTVFVPAGASTIVLANSGPSTPLFDDCSAELRKTVREVDEFVEKSLTMKDGADLRRKGVAMVAMACKVPRDSLPLWHMLFDTDETVRGEAEQALLDLVGPVGGGKSKEMHWEPDEWLSDLRLRCWQPN